MEMENQNLMFIILVTLFLLILFFHIGVKLCSWYLHKKYGIKIKVGNYGMLCFRNIKLQLRSGHEMEIEYAGISSSLFNSNLKSLFVFCLNDVRLQGDTDWIVSQKSSVQQSSKKSTESSPIKYLSFLKFVSLHVSNASVMQLGKSDEEFLLHLSFQEFNMNFSRSQERMQLNMVILSSSIKVFKHLSLEQDTESCICHFSSNIHFSIEALLGKEIDIQSVRISISDPELMLYEGFSIIKFKNYALNGMQTKKRTQNQNSEESVLYAETFSEDYEKNIEDYSNSIKEKFKKIPKIFDITVDMFSVKMMMKGGNRIFNFGIKFTSLHLEVSDFQEDELLPAISSSVEVKEVTAACDHVQFGKLLKCSFSVTMRDKLLDAKFNLSVLHILYQKEALLHFLNALLISNKKKSVTNAPRNVRKKAISDLLNGYRVKTSLGVEDISLSFEMPDCDAFSFGLIKGTSVLEHYICSKGTQNVSSQTLPKTIGSSLELLLETAFLKLGDSTISDYAMLKRYHYNNIPLSFGMVLLKVRFSELDRVIECMLDGCHLQWCPDSIQLVSYLVQYAKKSFTPTRTSNDGYNLQSSLLEESSVKKPTIPYSVELNFRSLNVFALNEYKTGILIRSDLLKMTTSDEKAKVLLEGFKVSYLNTVLSVYHCIRSSEIKNFDIFIEDASLICLLKLKESTIRISENMYINWNTTLHMALLTISQEFLIFKKKIINPSETAKETLRHSEGMSENEGTSDEVNKITSAPFSLSLQAKGHLDVGIVLSSKHRTVFSSSDINFNYNSESFSANSQKLVVSFDENDVFIFEKVMFSLIQGNEEHLLCRESFEELELCNNRLLSVHFDAVRFVFPYKYNFAEAFSEEFINIVKWLKITHKKKKTPFTMQSKLPPDLHIVCKVWTIEMEDDPFEVKLRDNNELLEDEYHESLKRQRMLDEKIESLQRTNLLLPGEKINLLYSKLAKKNAEIYIQRSQQLYQNGSMRTALCTWILEDVDILAIADYSYHGTERVVERMKQLDPESPFPDEGMEFTTLWARKVRCSVSSWTWQMRDFPQMPLHIREWHFWGFLIGAEQEALHRAKRTSVVKVNEPWSDVIVERSMPSLKFYHDLTFDMEEMSMAYGPSWEPIMAQINLGMELISRPSLDPSPTLPWWDKMRLLYHGRLTILAQHLNLFMRASPDPYNTTEHMEISWTEVFIEWTTGKIFTRGDLDMYVHTASKYDDIRVLHIPQLKLSVNLTWLCLGNPFDHHNVMPCAPDKVPEYSINQEHDSYRAFRSQNLNISYSFETRNSNVDDVPTMLLYSSTLRWIENLKMILTGVTRLTRRGVLFSNTKPRKPQLSRHYNRVCVSLNLHKFRIIYWMSFAKQTGLELIGGRLSLSSEHTLSLVNVIDGLNHRPRANWNIGYLTSDLSDSEIWLYNCMDEENESPSKSFNYSVERSYFLSVNRVSYGREEIVKDASAEDKEDTPTHRLVVHGLKGAWTRHNRFVVFSLFDSYEKTVLLKKNLSTEALRCFKGESQNTPQKIRSQTNASLNSSSAAPSPISNLQSSHAASMLQKLVAESEANPMVFTEEIEGTTRETQLHGISACCQTDDVLQKKWLIELVNSQVMLRGCETSGYVIVSAAKAKILQKLHSPVWKDRSLVSKTTWVGSFECMQYYATVDAGVPSPSVDDVMWLSVDNIEERESMVISDLPDLVGSGHSVGGVVSSTVGAVSDPESAPTQLQRIVSRCGCQFFYVSYGENMDPSTLQEVPPLPEDNDLWEQEVAVDCFTLTHHDLDMCTNSLQYAMILDLVNNLLLYVEPRKKEATNRLQYMRFQLQLCSIEDQREPILQLQENIRSLVASLRRVEKEAYVIHKWLIDNPEQTDYLDELHMLDNKINEHKEQLNSMNEELTMMISCFKETQIIASRSRQRASSQEKGVSTARRSEVCFKHAQWRLTDADGQLGISDIVLSNFLYSKVSKTNDSVEHLLEVGYIKMTNLLPNQTYKIVLQPTELQSKIPLDRQCLLRIFCRERAPVGGIAVKEHLEVNVVPITIGLTEAFYRAMLKFFFPGRDTEKVDDDEDEPVGTMDRKKTFKPKQSALFHVERDDIEKMKERAEKNHTFFSIKIPEVPIRVSYKGRKEKNIEDVHDISLVLSTIEYHNRTWTWLDLLMALKNDAKKTLVSQAIKQKLLKRNIPERDNQPQEEEKAAILLGTQHLLAGQDQTLKRGFLSRMRKDHH